MTRLSRWAAVVLAAYAVVLLVVLFSPTSGRQSAAVLWVGQVVQALGVPDRLADFDRLEVLLNVVIIAPVSFLGSLVRPTFSWRDWTAFGFVAALVVETSQGLLLPDRQASFSDVVANTCGALLGAGVCHLGRRAFGTVPRRSRRLSSSDASR